MPRLIDDETLLSQPMHSGPGTTTKGDLFKRAAAIMKVIKSAPGDTTVSVCKAASSQMTISEATIRTYLLAMESANLIENRPYKTNGGLCNAWHLARWLTDEGQT